MDFFRTKRQPLEEEPDETDAPLSLERITALTVTSPTGADRPLLTSGVRVHSGRFEIREVLGTGGEGVIYRAFDTLRQQDVALKTLHLEDASSIPALKREFRFLQDLVHPSLVSLHELVVTSELSFFTMSLVEGVNFLEAADSETRLRHLIAQLAQVLSFLHATGRVHRDIKPSNILIKNNQQLVLMDFGIGVNLSAPQSRSRGALGTPRYIAPELLRNEEASPLADAYSLGVLLFEALTGKHPSPTTRTEVSQRNSVRPSSVSNNVPEDLDDLCFGLLHPSPEKRLSLEAVLEVSEPFTHLDSASSSFLIQAGATFVGRTHELGRAEECFLRMKEGYLPIAIFLEADSGMGKSAFLDQFLSTKEDAVVLRSRCSEHELVRHKAIDGIIDDLVSYLEGRSTEFLEELVPETEHSILVQLFPEFERLPGFKDEARPSQLLGNFPALRQRAYLALAGVLGRLSDEVDLIVAIDDLQWGDLDSGRLLREVFGGADRPHCLLLLSYRIEERRRNPCLKQVLEGEFSLRSVLQSSEISLEPLLNRDARNLVLKVCNKGPLNERTLERLVKEAQGSPLLLTEMAVHLASEPISPDSIGISEILTNRVNSLSVSEQEAFALLCCSSSPLSTGVIQCLCEQSFEDVTLPLIRARLGRTRRGGQQLEVIHDSLREAMLQRLGDRRRYFHLRLAEGLVRTEGDAAEIARHFDSAGDPAAASDWAEQAAHRASYSFAKNHAVELFRLALRGANSPVRELRLKESLANALADNGRGAEAAPIFAAVASRSDEAKALRLRGQAAEHWLISGDEARGRRVLEEVQQAARLSWPATSSQATRLFLWERLQLKLALRSFRPNHGLPPSALLQTQLNASRAAWPIALISTAHGSANSARYLRLALKSNDRQHQALGFCMEAIYRATAGSSERDIANEHRKQAVSLMPRPEEPYPAAYLLHTQAQCSFFLGHPQHSLAAHESAQKLFMNECRNVSWELNSGRIFHSQALSLLGRLDVWETKLGQWLKNAEERGDACLYSAMKIGQARHTMATQLDPLVSRELLHQAIARWEPPFGGVHFFMEKFAQVYISALDGRPDDMLTRLDSIERDMKKSYMIRVQVPRLHLVFQRAYAELELAARTNLSSKQATLCRSVLRAARKLHREDVGWAKATALQLEALVDSLLHPSEQAARQLLDAAALFDLEGFFLSGGATRTRAGQLLGGEEGAHLIEQGTSAFREVGVEDPWRCMRAYIPSLEQPYF